MNIISLVLKNGSQYLKNNCIKNYQLDAELILGKVLNKSREYLLINDNKVLNEDEVKSYHNLLDRRKKNEPIAYITNEKEFWKSKFYIDKNVLIPRPDSEILLEKVLMYYKNKRNVSALDIGTGSGCLIISLMKEKQNFKGTAIDISKKALKTAEYNAKIHQLDHRIKFYKTSVDNFFKGKYDLIISNPPYINSLKLKYLDEDVHKFEPTQALEGGLDGFKIFRKILRKSSLLLKKGGKLVLEFGFDQKFEIIKLIKQEKYFINDIFKDYAKNDRCIICTKL
ncbi:peptide chain release factor N(5)-glutamine methyltransferase [Pelagibacterales bacterium SAG-MED15]|nr:peptide chain release factor N(5)-glutamine methyltransferase [Pelagibacterales bacterium SAG-MED15]